MSLLLRTNGLILWRRFKALRQQSRLLTLVIILFVVSYLVISFWLFHFGLVFLEKFPPLGTLLVERLMFLLFFFLFIMLLLSNLVIGYSNFFRNREAAFLMTQPVSAHVIFQWKLIESAVLASWAFIFLVAPLVAAFGLTRQVPWHYYLATSGMVALFIILPAVVGAFLAVQVGRYLDRRLFQTLALAFVLLLVLGTAIYLKPEPIPKDLTETRVLPVLDKLLHKTRITQFPFWPSHWLSSSVLLWSEGALRGAGFYLLVLLSHVLMFGSLAFVGMGNLYYRAASNVQSRASVFMRWKWFHARQQRRSENKFHVGLAERFLDCATALPPDVRALLIKDARTFWRDTTQWAQSLMLFGLLGVYIFNLRHFTQQLSSPFWVHLVSFLNLGACSLNLATLTTRFVFPQFSLEGKRIWIVGLTPLGMPQILRVKFWLAAVTAEVVTLALITLSCYMLKMDWSQHFFFSAAVTIMTFTLTSLAIGLGALYPNFREDNPSKIVSGFGGTFCLVLSFLYILSSVILLALVSPIGDSDFFPAGRGLLSLGTFLVLSFVIGWIPYQLGLRRVRTVEL